MNFDLLSFHVGEALEQLTSLRDEVSKGLSTEQSLHYDLQHVYHHLNFAWASRNCVKYEDADEHFDAFRRFAAIFQEELGAEAAGGRGEVLVEND